ncbi:MAG TPA: long-chain fatty acid--CoA ligase [Acidimicrobiia bacterium]|nr:long-chain fatty acid--CoA ligase [Acidimicrobiia bacterium]
MNIGRMLANTASRLPDRPAVTWGDRTLSYRDLDRRSDALARGLAGLGVRPGARVGVYMRNRPEVLEAMFACFKAGYCLVPLNSRLTADEVAFQLGDAGAAAIVTDGEGQLVAGAGAEGTGATVVVASPHPSLDDGAHDLEAVVAAGGDRGGAAVPVERDHLAWLFYTSGTTGRPKGAMLSHGNLAFVTASWLADLTPLSEDDVTLHAAPLSHGAGFHALAATARGAHQVIPTGTRFDPVAVLDLLRGSGTTNTWLVPTQIVMLTDAAAVGPVGLPRLRHVVYGGAPFPPAELRRALEVFGPVFVQLYGQGETPMTATVLPAADHAAALAGEGPERLASAGYARPGMDVRVLDGDDRDAPAGAVGEVCLRGPAVMLGYWNQEDATADTLRNGWLHTGDLGRMDEAGYLYLLDRAKDLIITGGSNVYAVEVEAALAGHPSVRDVAVVGVADRTWGELVVAVVVSDRPGEQVEAGLAAHCASVLAAYKRPRRYVFTDALPRNAYGKVLKRELRETLTPAD